MNKVILFIIFGLLDLSLMAQAVQKSMHFRFPIIVQPTITKQPKSYRAEYVTEIYPRFVGQFKFTDTLLNIADRENSDTVTETQYRWETDFTIVDSLSSDGLELKPDYTTSVTLFDRFEDEKYMVCYPVYLVNETTEPKLFIGKDGYVFALQEANVNKLYPEWYAIEGRGYDFCGNGYFRRKIEPGEFIMFLMPKYTGKDKALLRIRLKNGENISVSKPFEGVIDSKQFRLQPKGLFDEILRSTRGASIYWQFYGATVKEIGKY